MIHLLAPTDFSTASRAGIRLAIQWSRQQPTKILFVHVLHIPRLTKWSDLQYKAFAAAERSRCEKELDRFVGDIYKKLDLAADNYVNLVLEGISPDLVIAEYCRRHPEIDFICMGTRGAGMVKKIFGTYTGNLITHAEIPVIAVQDHYRTKPVRRILYATDLAHYEEELERVVAIARPLQAAIDVLHFLQPGEIAPNAAVMEKVYKKELGYGLHFIFKSVDPSRSMVYNLEEEIDRRQPSLVVMFTDKERTLFDKLFSPSKAERIGMELTIPLMVFGKADRIHVPA